MRIEVLQTAAAELAHAFRLRALRENPEAFGATFEEEVTLSADAVSSRLRATTDHFALGAFDERGSLVGIAGMYRERHTKSRHKGIVYGMFVAPEVRGRGIGKSLLAAVIERAKGLQDLEQLNLHVVTENVAARELYLAAGFESFGLERRGMKQGGKYFAVEHMVLFLR